MILSLSFFGIGAIEISMVTRDSFEKPCFNICLEDIVVNVRSFAFIRVWRSESVETNLKAAIYIILWRRSVIM